MTISIMATCDECGAAVHLQAVKGTDSYAEGLLPQMFKEHHHDEEGQ